MPRARSSEVPSRLSPRGPPPLRTSSSDSDPLHNRPVTDRSPKVGDRRSPRGVLPEPVNQKKLGTRIAGLETQLEQAQVELKVLKEQLASAEAAKKEAQKELEKKTLKAVPPEAPSNETQESSQNEHQNDDDDDDDEKETDVFEVPIEKMARDPPKVDLIQAIDGQDELKPEPIVITAEVVPEVSEMEKAYMHELALKNEEIASLKAKVEEKEEAFKASGLENESLKSQLNDTISEMAAAKAKEEEMSLNMNQLGEKLEESKGNIVQLNDKLKEVEEAKESLEIEMKKLRVQTEQWRKAADAAAAILAGGVDMNNGRRISERCGSMDKHYGNVFEPAVGGYGGYMGSPGLGDDNDDGFGSGKRKGSSGIKMFGDLWKKKGQK